jgi:hypothetical protein
MDFTFKIRDCGEGVSDKAILVQKLRAIADQIEIAEPSKPTDTIVSRRIIAPDGKFIGQWRISVDEVMSSANKSDICTELEIDQKIWILSVWDGENPISYCHKCESDAWKEALRITVDMFEEDEKQILNDWHLTGEYGFIRRFMDRQFPCDYVFDVNEVCI